MIQLANKFENCVEDSESMSSVCLRVNIVKSFVPDFSKLCQTFQSSLLNFFQSNDSKVKMFTKNI